MNDLKIRCSALGKIMGTPKKKGETLTQTAKTYIKSLVKQNIFYYETEISSKYLDKGNDVEDKSIDLYNFVHFTNFKKNEESEENEFIKGTCDIDAPTKIIDIKSPWSKETFPATPDDGIDKDYEWQLRGYMWLYGKSHAELAYCLVDTPEWLLEYENNLTIHEVGDIEPQFRVTILKFEQDKEIEKAIKAKVIEARKYANWYKQQILNK